MMQLSEISSSQGDVCVAVHYFQKVSPMSWQNMLRMETPEQHQNKEIVGLQSYSMEASFFLCTFKLPSLEITLSPDQRK